MKRAAGATLADGIDFMSTGASKMASLQSMIALVLAVAFGSTGVTSAQANQINIYTYREAKLIQPLFDAFTKDTGINVNVISASSGLEQRIKTEGANSPADVLLTVDISRLEEAVSLGVTQPIKSATLDKYVPAQYRDPEGHWYAVALRARAVYASKERVQQNALTYEELADPKWKGKICIRSGQHYYNVALFAAMVAKHGEAKAEAWLKGLKANLAQKPWAEGTKVILPAFQGGGTHVNISGVVLAKHSPNHANALKFVEWMVGEKAQQMHADLNYEYPLRAGVPINPTIAGYGPLKADAMPLSQIAENRKKASALVDKVGFNN